MKSAKKQKKGHISEQDMFNLLQRYPAEKVLALLQEVYQSAGAKMDRNALVKKTATGITNAREYQMLWRHIAYCDELLDKVDDGAESMDDDSDLEYELEAYPAVSAEAAAEAAACVKVLIGSGLPGDSKFPRSTTVEAPLTINIPKGQSSKPSSEKSRPASIQGTNITVPVSVQKQPVPQGSVQKKISSSRKRKLWSEEEDLELLAAVRKCGEGNWENMLKGDFKGDRTKLQLSQRWAKIKTKQSNLSIGAQSTGPQLSDAQLAATRQALNMAFKDNLLTVGNGAATPSNPGKLNSSNNAVVNNTPPQPQQSQSTPAGGNPISSKPGTSSSVTNPRAPPRLNPDSSMVTKAAVAAGARIASPSDAALFKAAQANNAIHIMPKGGNTLIKSSVTSTSNPTPSTHLEPNRTMPFGSQPVRANLVRPTTPSVPISRATGSQQVRSTFVRPVVLPPPSSKASTSFTLPNNSSASLSHSNEVKVLKEEKTSEAVKAPLLPLPLVRPVPTQNIEARQNPSPASSSGKLAASSQCSVNTEKVKSAIGKSRDSAIVSAENKNESLADGKHGKALSEKREEIASEKQQNLPSSKVGGD